MGYRRKYVAFIDILGYRKLLKKAEQNKTANKVIAKIEELLQENVTWKKFEHPIEYSVKMFSDCACLSAPFNSWGLVCLFTHLMSMQSSLIKSNILIRGAIAYGNHHESENLIFSSGLVKAYELESKKAIFPRIIIDDRVIKKIGNSKKNSILRSFILQDYDNQLFLDYLWSYWNQGDYSNEISDILKAQRRLIIKSRRMHHNKPKILQKFAWLSMYHNQVIKKITNLDKFLVGEETFAPVYLENDRKHGA